MHGITLTLEGALDMRYRTFARGLKRIVAGGTLAAVALMTLAAPAAANHSWKNYHWARTANPFTIQLGDNVTSAWDGQLGVASPNYLKAASDDWTLSTVLDTIIVPGGANPKICRPTSGRVEVCNSTYGKNGWLGIAQIWVSGDHITQGVVKLNDTYFNTATYNKPEWRLMVMCQEIGHTFGLNHQDEAFDNPNLGTCMDYTNDPTSNQHPNAHDYAQLETIYAHPDSSTTLSSATASQRGQVDGGATPAEWGRAVAFTADGRGRVFARDLGAGRAQITFVTWAN